MANYSKIKKGQLIQNSEGYYAKVIGVKNGMFSLTRWTTEKNAKQKEVAEQRLNTFGLDMAGVKADGTAKKTEPKKESNQDKKVTSTKDVNKTTGKENSNGDEKTTTDAKGDQNDQTGESDQGEGDSEKKITKSTLNEMKLEDLQNEAKTLELNTEGTRDELIARIAENYGL